MWPQTNFEKKVFIKMILKLRPSQSQSRLRKNTVGSRKSSAVRKSSSSNFSNAQLYEHRASAGKGDPCASHRGSPSPSPVPRRKTSSKILAGNSRKSSKEQNQNPRKLSIVPTKEKLPSKPEAHKKMTKPMASSRSKRLYRFKRNYSDGYSESDPEDWFKNFKFKQSEPGKKIKKKKKLKADKILAVSKLLNFGKTSTSPKVPEVIVQDFSKRRDSIKINKVKLKALTGFIDHLRTKNKIVDVIEVPEDVSSKEGHAAFVPKNDSKKNGKLFNRTKLLAITSFTRHGKKENVEDIQYVEVENSESESENDEVEGKVSYTESKEENVDGNVVVETKVQELREINSSKEEHVAETQNSQKSEPLRSLEKEASSTLKEDQNISNLLSNEEKPISVAEKNTEDQAPLPPKKVESVVESEGGDTRDTKSNKDEKETKNDYTEDQFQKSRNSRTAAMFQKHGKLLDDIPLSQPKAKTTAEEKSKKSCCFPFCCWRKDKSTS